MEKYIQLPAYDTRGMATVEAVRFPAPGVEMEKTASLKYAALEPDMRDFIAGLSPTEGKLYVLVNALGAYEFWGPNYNADAFREAVLANSDPSNGYKTFLKATVFRHHLNKKPDEQGFGKIVVSTYNPRMHRVELLLEIDRARAAALGHQDLLDRLDAGENCAVSMGMRTSYDECSWCGHRSYKADGSDKCMDLKPLKKGGHGNKLVVRADGVVCCMFNVKFVAFDLSFVDVGADPQGYTIAKVARLMSAPAGKHTGALPKLAEIIKHVPAMSSFENCDPLLPANSMRSLAERPLPDVLSAAAQVGIVLQPEEFQWLALRRAGYHDLAQQLAAQGRVAGACPRAVEAKFSLPTGRPGPWLLDVLADAIGSRTIFGGLQPEPRGLARTTVTIQYGTSPVTDAISQSYDGYRRSLLDVMPLFAKQASVDPQIASMLSPDWLFTSGELSKVAALGPKSITLLGALPAAYLFSRLFQKEGETGVVQFVREHPIVASSFLLGILRAAT